MKLNEVENNLIMVLGEKRKNLLSKKQLLEERIEEEGKKYTLNSDKKLEKTSEYNEYVKDLEQVNKELEQTKREIQVMDNAQKYKVKIQITSRNIKNIENAKQERLAPLQKAKEQCKTAIEQVKGSYELNDGKLSKSDEYYKYQEDLTKINSEIDKVSHEFDNRIQENNRTLNSLITTLQTAENSINNMIEKYNIKGRMEKEAAEKRKAEEYDKAWAEAIEENKRRDAEKEYDKAWAEAIEENKRIDAEREYDRAWAEAIEENKRIDAERANQENQEQGDPNPSRGVLWEYEHGGTDSRSSLLGGKKDETTNADNIIKNIKINEPYNEVSVTYQNNKLDQYDLKPAVKTGKKELKSEEIKNLCKRISGNRIKGILLRRKLNPAIITALRNKNQEVLENYIETINGREELKFEVQHNLGSNSLSFFDKRKMKRIAKTENEIDKFEVYGLNKGVKQLAAATIRRKITGRKEEKRKFRGKGLIKKLGRQIIKKKDRLVELKDSFVNCLRVDNEENEIENRALSNMNSSDRTKENTSDKDKDIEIVE